MMNTDDERLNQLGEMERCYSTQLCKPSCIEMWLPPPTPLFLLSSTPCCAVEEYPS